MFWIRSKAQWVVVLLALLLVVGVFAAGQNIKYGGTLTLVEPNGAWTPDFNPFLGGTTNGNPYVISAMYEPLFYYNPVTGKIVPMLATTYKWTDNNLKLIITTRSGVKWSDGIPFTASDVAFTFNLLKKYPALDLNGIWAPTYHLQSVVASGTNTIEFDFSSPYTPMLWYISQVFIVPQHIWSKIQNPATFANDTNPVGTGPFLFKSFSSPTNTAVFTKNPNYWMTGKPYINGFKFTDLTSNNACLLQMLKGQADWFNGYVVDVPVTWAAKDPSVNKFWYPVSASPWDLYLNWNRVPAFTNPVFRKAIDLAINKGEFWEKVSYGVGPKMKNMAMISPAQGEWMDPTLTTLAASLASYNPNKAMSLLESIGYHKDSSGNLICPDGKPFPTLKDIQVSGWNDFLTTAQLIAADLKAIGIKMTITQETYAQFYASMQAGTGYDTAIMWTNFGPSPYFEYNSAFNPDLTAPWGKSAVSNFSRYTNPLITAALKVYSTTSDLQLQKEAMYTMERIFLQELPIIPLRWNVGYGVYSERHFVGWPSDSNPYCASGQMAIGDEEQILLNVHLK